MAARNKFALVAFLFAAICAAARAQIFSAPAQSPAKAATVQYLYPEQITAPAAQPTEVALHFRIASGYHINSHQPKDTELVPTTITFPEESGVRLVSATYPPGVDFALPVDPTHPLSVYTGEFVIRARITVAAGSHLAEAKLRYQACDDRACLPPKTITAPIEVVGK